MALLERAGRLRVAALGSAAGAVALTLWLLVRSGDAALGAAAPPPGRVVAEVLNGAGRTGLARRVTRLLRERGVDVVYFGNASGRADTTLVLVRRGELAQGYAASRALGLGVVRLAPDSLRRVDVSIVLGRDYRPPADAPPF